MGISKLSGSERSKFTNRTSRHEARETVNSVLAEMRAEDRMMA